MREDVKTDLTIDSIWSDDIQIAQPRKGYRFALDAVLLAHFLKASATDDLLEIGTGSGVIAILLSRLQSFRSLLAVELQKELARLAARNFKANGVSSTVLVASAADLPRVVRRQFDLLFANPPYRIAGAGKLNPLPQKAIARHELKMKLQDLFEAAAKLLRPEGRMSSILPFFRKDDFDRLAKGYGYHTSELQWVHSFSADPPVFFLATLTRHACARRESPPIIMYERAGVYTDQMQRMLKAPL